MLIIVKINQAACLAKGLDAPSSTAKIELNPKLIPADMCQFLASKLQKNSLFLDIEFDKPTPTLQDLDQALRVLRELDTQKARNAAIFQEHLSAENLRLHNEGRLSTMAKLKTVFKMLHPLLDRILHETTPNGCMLTQICLRLSEHDEPIQLTSDLSCKVAKIEPMSEELASEWFSVLDENWLDYIKQIESHGTKIVNILKIQKGQQICIQVNPKTPGIPERTRLLLIGVHVPN